MTELVRPWRGISPEDRQSERRARLLDSCLNIVGSEGVSSTTIDRVCADAKLTKRYFYESFTDLDALLLAAADALFDRLFDRMVAAAAAELDEMQRVRSVVSAVITDLAADPRGARLYVESPGHPGLRARRDQAVDAFTEFVGAHVLERLADDGRTDLRIRLIVAGATDLITAFLAGTIDTDQAAVVDAVVTIATALQT